MLVFSLCTFLPCWNLRSSFPSPLQVEREVAGKSHIILGKKYANRWMLSTLHRPIKGWPRLGPLTQEEQEYWNDVVARERLQLYGPSSSRRRGKMSSMVRVPCDSHLLLGTVVHSLRLLSLCTRSQPGT